MQAAEASMMRSRQAAVRERATQAKATACSAAGGRLRPSQNYSGVPCRRCRASPAPRRASAAPGSPAGAAAASAVHSAPTACRTTNERATRVGGSGNPDRRAPANHSPDAPRARTAKQPLFLQRKGRIQLCARAAARFQTCLLPGEQVARSGRVPAPARTPRPALTQSALATSSMSEPAQPCTRRGCEFHLQNPHGDGPPGLALRCPTILPSPKPYGSEPPRVASSAAAASITFPCSSWRVATGTQGGGCGPPRVRG